MFLRIREGPGGETDGTVLSPRHEDHLQGGETPEAKSQGQEVPSGNLISLNTGASTTAAQMQKRGPRGSNLLSTHENALKGKLSPSAMLREPQAKVLPYPLIPPPS